MIGSLHVVSTAESNRDEAHGTSLLPRDLSARELRAAPALASIDALLIEDLTAEEDDSFASALTS